MQRIILFFCFSLMIGVTGCRAPQSVQNTWKDTKYYYRTYVNTPAVLDMDDKGDVAEYEKLMGQLLTDFDAQIQALERALYNSDRKPDTAWVNMMTKRFPWLSGIALLDETGQARARIPSDYPKGFEIGNLLQVDPKQHLKDLRAFVQMHPLGPEIYVGNPVYLGSEFKGVITVQFDPRTLLARTTDPSNIMIAGPEGVLWSGTFQAESTPIASINWGETVKDRSSGVVSNANGSFYWITRYVGNLPLIYAVKIKGDFPADADNLAGLSQANAFALGPIMLPDAQSPSSPASSRPSLAVSRPASAYPVQAPARRGGARAGDHARSGIEGDLGDIGAPNVAPDAPPAGAVIPAAKTPVPNPLPE